MDGVPAVLDARQLTRIQSTHRGFLYQHLYAVGALLLASKCKVDAVSVERDEDIELAASGERLYVQVKTRSESIMPSDISDVLTRFEQLRTQHSTGHRSGRAKFFIVLNQELGPSLTEQLQRSQWPTDTSILTPSAGNNGVHVGLPPAFGDVNEIFSWCAQQAETLPFLTLSPESLVWKLAAVVQHVSSGSSGFSDHTITAIDLPELFEQLLVQLQDFPTPPPLYRPQECEPGLDFSHHVRIICGFSGSGKTAWAAQAAMLFEHPCAYFDVGSLPGPAVASALVRELGARFSQHESEEFRRVLIPGAQGLESLNALDIFVGKRGIHPIIVLDNAHRIQASDLRAMVEATTNIKFLLLCQPTAEIQELESLLSISRETLKGWDVDSVAVEVTDLGAFGSMGSFARLRFLTGGLPLFVQSAGRLAVSEFEGKIELLCQALEAQTNMGETAQEVLLARSFEALPTGAKAALSVMSIADVGLNIAELNRLLADTLQLNPAQSAAVVRSLRPTGMIEVFGGQQIKVHDSIRVLGYRHRSTLDDSIVRSARTSLKNMLFSSISNRLDTARFSLFVRLLVDLGEVKTIVELASSEMFHEMGLTDEIIPALKDAAESETVPISDRFWAFDSLVFDALKRGELAAIPHWTSEMGLLLESNELGNDASYAYLIKLVYWRAEEGKVEAVLALLEDLGERLPEEIGHQLVLRYTAALALWKVGHGAAAEEIARDLISDYFTEMGISPREVIGRNPRDLWPILRHYERSHDDIKHLADTLELCAAIVNSRGGTPGMLRLHAMKFYLLVGAVDSLIRVGQDMADEFVARRDYEGARETLEKHVLPIVTSHKLVKRVVSVRSQYAVVLALSGEHSAAQFEMQSLEPYRRGLTPIQLAEVEAQTKYIGELRLRPAIPLNKSEKSALIEQRTKQTAAIIGMPEGHFSYVFDQLMRVEATGSTVDITRIDSSPHIGVKLLSNIVGETFYGSDPQRLSEQLRRIKLSDGQTVSMLMIWTINPMPAHGFTEAELDEVDLQEGDVKAGPNGETVREMIRNTYRCKSKKEEDMFLRRFIAS